MDTPKRYLKHLSLLGIAATMIVVFPSFVQRARVISIKKAMNIHTSKVDPPRLAFEEIYTDERKLISEWDWMNSKQGTFLTAGEGTFKFVGKTPVQILNNRKIVLQEMTFTHEETRRQAQADRNWVELLPREAQRRIQASQEKFQTLEEDWALPTPKELAARKIDEATKRIDSETARLEKPKVIVQSVGPDGAVQLPESFRTAGVEVRKDPKMSLSGHLEVKGLPSGSPQWQIHVARYEDGIKKEDGTVNLEKSTYSITVPAVSGTLVAQMIDANSGLVLGEGSLRLSPYSKDQLSGKAKLVIEKAHHEVAANLGSFYNNSASLVSRSVRREKPIMTRVLMASLNAEGRTDETGTYRYDQIQKGSWALLRTEAKNFHPGLYLVQSGSEKRLPLFPSMMIQALKQIIRDQTRSSEVPETGSIVWGQVLQDGKPLAGAEVDVEFMDGYQPVYFNNLLIPDPHLKATGENGYFAFMHLPSGFHSLVATNGHSYLSHANVVVDDETVSIAQLESSLQTEKTDLKVFDAFTGKAMGAEIEMQSLPAALEVKGFAQIHLNPVSRLSFMNVTPRSPEYVKSLQIYDDNTDSIHVPMVRADWMQSLMAERKINVQPNTGVILGFVPSGKYEVFLGHHDRFPNENIVYFDAQGRASQTSSPGGGFAIYNVPPGVQSVVVMDNENNLLQTQVLPADPSLLTVLKFR